MSETDKDDVLEHLSLATNHEAGLIPTSTQILLLSVANERDALQARVAELEESAARWDALMASDRIRHFGSANFNWSNESDEVTAPKNSDKYLHLTIDLWDKHPDPHPSKEYPQERCRNFLITYVDHIRARQALKENQND